MVLFRPGLGFVQFRDGFLDVLHGVNSVTAPFATGVLQVGVRTLQSTPSGVYFGGYIALRG
jgi:hypothetical protein